jgi:hypothetical protein
MDGNGYYDSMYFELFFLKSKISDIIYAVERNPRAAKLIPQLPRLQFLEGHLSKRLDQLGNKCTAEWCLARRNVEIQQQVA